MSEHVNRLAGATSPYLLQHADNPVAWQPWDAEALALSRDEDRPILLSIGYSTCHWCHAMAHECFEDTGIASFMNEHFICVKVDREDRPDIDQFYSLALRSLTGRSGWPATLFLTPDLSPFFGGTYFPATDAGGLPGFLKVLEGVDKAWREQRPALVRNGATAVERMLKPVPVPREGSLGPDPEMTQRAVQELAGLYDSDWGGFGEAPKFPRAPVLSYLARRATRGDTQAAAMLHATLSKMARGAIRDQIDGGFHRYTTDRCWLNPHFEKTLYDNAQLARLYVIASTIFPPGDEFRRVGRETLDFILRDMRDRRGAFVAGLDADGDAGEGSYYQWQHEELAALAGHEAAESARRRYKGRDRVIWLPADDTSGDVLARLRGARRSRKPPAADGKVLAGWNGLAIAAFADAGRLLGEPGYVGAAIQAAEVVLDTLRTGDGRLARSWRDGRVSGPGFLDDYAMLGLGCLTLHEVTLQPRWLRVAQGLALQVKDLFADPDQGIVFLTSTSPDAALMRAVDTDDTALPSATAAAAELLWRVGRIAGDRSLAQLGRRALGPALERAEGAVEMRAAALSVLDMELGPTVEVALVGDPAAESTARLARVLASRYRPGLLVVSGPGTSPSSETVALLAGRAPDGGRAVAYICQGFTCRRPLTDPDELAAELDGLGV